MDAGPTPSPRWPDGRCPPWCTRVHDAQDHPEDRYHHDDGIVLTGVLGRVDHGSMRREATATALVVQRQQWPDQDRVWVMVAAEDAPRAAVTVDADLARALGHALRRLV